MSIFYFVKCTKSFLLSLENDVSEINLVCENNYGNLSCPNGTDFSFDVSSISDKFLYVNEFHGDGKFDIQNSPMVTHCLTIQGNNESFQLTKKEILDVEQSKLKKRAKVKSDTFGKSHEQPEARKPTKKRPAAHTQPVVVKRKPTQTTSIRTGVTDDVVYYNKIVHKYDSLRLKYADQIARRYHLENQFRDALARENEHDLQVCNDEVAQFCGSVGTAARKDLHKMEQMYSILGQMRDELRKNSPLT